MKERRTPCNSRTYTRQRMLDVLLPRLHQPGRIATIEAWNLCRGIPGVISYDVCRAVFHGIMLDMIYHKLAGYTKTKGVYRIRKREEKYNPDPIEIPVREKYEPPDPPSRIIRPAATKSTQELLIEKYT